MTIKLCQLDLAQLLIRYYLMMTVVFIAGFTGTWLLAILALPIFLTAILGMRFEFNAQPEAKERRLPRPTAKRVQRQAS
ncbi:MAG: hypothetical protein AAFV95_25680 [Bacteroidota bacterium]